MNENNYLNYLLENNMKKFQELVYKNEKEILNENYLNDKNYKNTTIHNIILINEIELSMKLKSVYILCDLGININAQNQNHQTVIHLAIIDYLNHQTNESENTDDKVFEDKYGYEAFELVKCFLINGCDLTITDKHGLCSYNYIKRIKNKNVFENLCKLLRVYYPTYWIAIDNENMDLIRRLVNSWCKFINVKKRLNKEDYCTIIDYARKKKFEAAINLFEKLEMQMNLSFSVFARNLPKIESILTDNKCSLLINYHFKNMIDSNATLKYYILKENNIDLVNCIKKYSQKFTTELTRINDYMLDESRSHDIPVLFSLLKSNISLDLLKLIIYSNNEASFKIDQSELRYKGETLLFFSVDIHLNVEMLEYLLDFNFCQNEMFTNRNSLNMTIFEYLSLLKNIDQYFKLFIKVIVNYIKNSERLRIQLAYNGFNFDTFIADNKDLFQSISSDLTQFLEKVRDYQDHIKIFHEAVELNDYHKVCKYFKYESDYFKNNLIDSRVSSNNQSVIHRATLNQNVNILEFLLENRDPSKKLDLIRDHCYRTPLHYAYGMINNKKVTSLLLEFGFSENVFDKDGMSPLDFNERQESEELKELILLHKNKKLSIIEPNPWSFNVWTRIQQEKDSNKQITLFNSKILNHHGHSHGHSHGHIHGHMHVHTHENNNQIINNESCNIV